MKLPGWQQTRWDWLVLLIAATGSFLLSALPFYPYLNSDLAIHVLMSVPGSFAPDAYFWGQDRLGSLVPFTARLLTLTGMPPIWSCSLAEWLYLVAGAVGCWHFLPHPWLRPLFTILWFFPPFEMRYHLLPAHPYGEQMAMLVWTWIITDRWLKTQRHSLLLPAATLAVLSIWVSDFSLVVLMPLPWVFRKGFSHVWKQKNFRIYGGLSVALCAFAALCLYGLKAGMEKEYSFTEHILTTADELQFNVLSLGAYILNVTTLNSASPFDTLMFAATLALVALAWWRSRPISGWNAYFMWAALVAIFSLIPLHWLAVNHVMLKYFIPGFWLLWLFAFRAGSDRMAVVLATWLVMGSVGSLMHLYHKHNEEPLAYAELQPFAARAPISIIGTYWNSYVLALADPVQIRCTTRDDGSIRNRAMMRKAMDSDTIWAVRNGWFDAFPDTLIQYNYQLHFSGQTFTEGRFELGGYTVISRTE